MLQSNNQQPKTFKEMQIAGANSPSNNNDHSQDLNKFREEIIKPEYWHTDVVFLDLIRFKYATLRELKDGTYDMYDVLIMTEAIDRDMLLK